MYYFLFADSEFIEQFHSHPEYNANKSEFEHMSDNCFDGTWLGAVALNCTVNRLREIGISDSIFKCRSKMSGMHVMCSF